MALEFIFSEKGDRKLLLDGYVYVKDRVIVSKTYWKCENFASCKCCARVQTQADSVVKHVGDHNHALDVTSMEAMDKWTLSICCHLSICLSSVVCNVCAPTHAVQIFDNISMVLGTLAIH